MSGLLRVIPNDQMVEAEEAEEREREEARHPEPVLTGLAGHVTRCWQAARDEKNRRVTHRLQKALRAKEGEYDPEKLRAIREFGGSEEYARVTANKQRIATSWLRDVYMGQSERPWSLQPTPVPDIPPDAVIRARKQIAIEFAEAFALTGTPPDPDLMEQRSRELEEAESQRVRDESRKAAERMERLMHDQLIEGGWTNAFGDFLDDFCLYPAAHFKGPVLRTREAVKWVQQGGQWAPKTEQTIAPEFERVDPFRAYPAPNTCSPQEGYFIELLTYSRQDFYDLIGVEGFDEEAIRTMLEEHGAGGLVNWLGHTDDRGDRDITDTTNVQIDALEFHGPVRGQDLLDWGMDPEEVEDPDRDYEACVWLVGRHVIKAQLNYNPLGLRPYYKASFEEVPGQYWGMGLADLLDDVQGVVNATVRSLVNNMAMASGPMVGYNVDRLPAGEDLKGVVPWRVWQFTDSQFGNNTTPPIEFFQPQPMVQELLQVLEKFHQYADDFSLVPRYMAGNDRVGGAGRTASGLSMLLNAANKGLKGIVSNVDVKIIEPLLMQLYTFNMLFSDDDAAKGDAHPMARGAVSLMQMESLQLRRNEFLMATANPLDSQIVGLEGRAEILREVAKGLEMDVNKVIPPGPPGGVPQQAVDPQAMPAPQQNGETLEGGAAVTDNFSPNSMRQVA